MARRYIVTGRVQGVGFRNYVEHVASRISVQGFVRNRSDGSVEVFGMGTSAQLKRLREALERGPLMSDVTGVDEEPARFETQYEGRFTIELTAG